MPCVLPVLTMKVSALLSSSGYETEGQRLAHFREHNVLFAAGILTWFLVLAFCVGALGLAWGGLFQNTHLVYGLLILVFLLSLSLFDVFTLPVLDFKVGASRNPKRKPTSPASSPPLLGHPVQRPSARWRARLGGTPAPARYRRRIHGNRDRHGPALPRPGGLARRGRILPKPGAWTGIMERLVGFFLMGTAIYLLSILPESQRLAALVTLLVCALAAWMWGHWGGLRASGPQKLFTARSRSLWYAAPSGGACSPPPNPRRGKRSGRTRSVRC